MDELLSPLAELKFEGARVVAHFSLAWVVGGGLGGLFLGFTLGPVCRLMYAGYQRVAHARSDTSRAPKKKRTGSFKKNKAPTALWRDCALSESCESLLSIAGQVLAPVSILFLSAGSDRKLRLEHHWTSPGAKPLPWKKEATTWPKKLWKQAQEEQRPWTLPLATPRLSRFPSLTRKTPSVDALVTPVRYEKMLWGLLIVHRSEGAPWEPQDIALTTQIAAQIGLAATQAQALSDREEEGRARAQALAHMEHLATHDGLTGLINRRHFKALFDSYLAQAERYERRLSLVMLDIDHFKGINDRFGHPVGDRVLEQVSNVLRASARRADIVARLGGEEFAILMEETGTGGALKIAERVRCSVQAAVVGTPFGDVRATLSLGVASFPENGKDQESLTKHADSALYEAKRTGRNKTVVFWQSPSQAENLT